MRRLCAWCGSPMPGGDPDAKGDDTVSHGLCPKCADNILFQSGVELQTYLDSLDAPVAVLTSDCVVQFANSNACRVLHKQLGQIEGRLGGQVFECAHARLPEGCGKTVHCTGCAIRRAVAQTHATGEPVYDMPAVLTQNDLDHPHRVRMRVSTEKVGDLILLRVDEVPERHEDNG